ncbi:MAG: phosphotransferase [Proteobacteria bacterium]|nr:phosphotransferase [Pseudomonadota bacterium]
MGLLLLEDLGDLTYSRALAQGESEMELYSRAVDVLVDIHRRHIAVSVPNGLALYDEDKLVNESLLFTDWYMPQVIGHPTRASDRLQFQEIWYRLFQLLEDVPDTLVLRDFHADNLMWLPDRKGLAACGLLDFQDAVVGKPVYDLMSLLEDARRDLTPGVAHRMLDRYYGALPNFDRKLHETAYAILGAQRHCKVIGIFTRLAERDSKYEYLLHIPRVWKLLSHACRHPVLAPLKSWLDHQVPVDHRQGPIHWKRA